MFADGLVCTSLWAVGEGWKTGWLAGWMAGWLVASKLGGCFAGWRNGWLAGRLCFAIIWLIGGLACWLAGKLDGWLQWLVSRMVSLIGGGCVGLPIAGLSITSAGRRLDILQPVERALSHSRRQLRLSTWNLSSRGSHCRGEADVGGQAW